MNNAEKEMECEPSIESEERISAVGKERTKEFEFVSPNNKDQDIVKIEFPGQFVPISKIKGERGGKYEEIVRKHKTLNSITSGTQHEDASTKSTTKTNERMPTHMLNQNIPHCIFEDKDTLSTVQRTQNNNPITRLDESRLNCSVFEQYGGADSRMLSSSISVCQVESYLCNKNNRKIERKDMIPVLEQEGQCSNLDKSWQQIEKDIQIIDVSTSKRQSKNKQKSKNKIEPIYEPDNKQNSYQPSALTTHQIIQLIQNNQISSPEDTQFIDLRHCLECNLTQKIRSRHCKICKQCVATYDHHCPWVGNCIGEKNKCIFWWFLAFQLSELLFPLTSVIISLISEGEKINIIFFIVDMAILLPFTIMVLSLLIYHTFLATENFTTWEYQRWQKITYLKEWPQQYGSPFSRGCFKNVRQFCKYIRSSNNLNEWYIPNITSYQQKQIQKQQQQQQQQQQEQEQPPQIVNNQNQQEVINLN